MKHPLCFITTLALLSGGLPAMATATDQGNMEELKREVRDLRIEKEILEKKLRSIQTLMDLPDPAHPGPQYNDQIAQEILDKMARATKRFARTHNGIYPQHMNQLTDVFPPYIKDNYCNKIYSGYHYNCHMSADGFKFVATPLRIGSTGSRVFSITTGGPFFDK
ncbi:MAG: hypothetical protein K8I00_07720 [Candidatus Omnitrophica bacterium]|nr:hypothetical protein [Candidatus Omnitrophota bacterium]